MCISDIMTRGDLFALECGTKFYLENEDGETLEAVKIAQHEGSSYKLIIADFAELGEEGEGITLDHQMFSVTGDLEHIPLELQSFGDHLKLCGEARPL